MVGPDPRRCAFAILILGYTFDVILISLVLASTVCHALDFRITLVVVWDISSLDLVLSFPLAFSLGLLIQGL
jgi:hypothetical protein